MCMFVSLFVWACSFPTSDRAALAASSMRIHCVCSYFLRKLALCEALWFRAHSLGVAPLTHFWRPEHSPCMLTEQHRLPSERARRSGVHVSGDRLMLSPQSSANFDPSSAKVRVCPERRRVRPNLTLNQPNLGRLRPMLARHRGIADKCGLDSTNCRSSSAEFGQNSANSGQVWP